MIFVRYESAMRVIFFCDVIETRKSEMIKKFSRFALEHYVPTGFEVEPALIEIDPPSTESPLPTLRLMEPPRPCVASPVYTRTYPESPSELDPVPNSMLPLVVAICALSALMSSVDVSTIRLSSEDRSTLLASIEMEPLERDCPVAMEIEPDVEETESPVEMERSPD